MAITPNDIKLLESEVMADTTDGGGRRTSRIIPDGVAGNVFPKVSRLDAVYGRVNLRKIYGTARTANVDTYAGSHAIVTDPPDNARIHTTLFSTGSEFDSRAAARDRIESYVTSGPESRMTLVGRQLPGQQTFLAYQRPEEPLPEVGDVYCLSAETNNVVLAQQYVRIQSVDHDVRTYEDDKGEFSRRVLTVDIGSPLRYEFKGVESPSRFSDVKRDSRLRTTTVVDAARYYGIQPLTVDAAQNDLTIRVQSIYTPIVPTTNRETPISNASLGGALNIAAASAATVSESLPSFAVGQTRYTLRAITPGSLSISGYGIPTVSDNGAGAVSSAAFVATVDYETGAITRTGGSAGSSSVSAIYIPAVAASQTAHTIDIPVSINNRGSVYAQTLVPLPSPGTVIVDFRAMGKWYRLRDNGAGSLSGDDPAYGAGTVDYASGAAVVTLGALPDIDTSVLFSWGTPVAYQLITGGDVGTSANARQEIKLPDLPVNPGSVSITYVSGGVTYAATSDIAGVISGGGVTGSVNHVTGNIVINYPARLPDPGIPVTVAYQQVLPVDEHAPPIVLSTSIPSASVMSLGGPVEPGTLNGSVSFSAGGVVASAAITDDGTGVITIKPDDVILPNSVGVYKNHYIQVVGIIDYATGEITINAPLVAYEEAPSIRWIGLGGTSGVSWPASQD